jgi:hypothetical protein
MRIALRAGLVVALLAGSGVADGNAATPAHGRTLPFVDDDYAKALSEARAKGLPLFIEAWAPW